MRRTVLALALAAAAAACADQPTDPRAPAPDGPALSRAGTADVEPIPWILSPKRTYGFTSTDDIWRYPNRPEPDLGGDLVVWRSMADPYFGPVDVMQARISTGGQTRLAQLQTAAGVHTNGRYTSWQDGTAAIMVVDNATARRRRVEGRWLPADFARIVGARMVFADLSNRTLELCDLQSGVRRVLVDFGSVGYGKLYGLAFDGRYVAFMVDGVAGTGLVVLDTETGQSRTAAPFDHTRRVAGVSADRGRVVYATGVGGGPVSLYLYDAARGETRRLTTGARQANPEISGNLVVWDDTRNAGDSPYVYNHDVYLRDLATGRELALANGPEWTSDPQIDGGRVVWTELNGQRWNVVGVEVAPASVPLLLAEVKRMLAAGAIRTPGTARSLDVFLEQAASALASGNRGRAAERLGQFSAMARQEAGKQIEGSAALRLQGIAAGVIAGL